MAPRRQSTPGSAGARSDPRTRTHQARPRTGAATAAAAVAQPAMVRAEREEALVVLAEEFAEAGQLDGRQRGRLDAHLDGATGRSRVIPISDAIIVAVVVQRPLGGHHHGIRAGHSVRRPRTIGPSVVGRRSGCVCALARTLQSVRAKRAHALAARVVRAKTPPPIGLRAKRPPRRRRCSPAGRSAASGPADPWHRRALAP